MIGAPLTMTFLVLETTGDFGITTAALAASLCANVLVRETFGYSFSTWRLHLRGETIRSAHDVGFLRSLTAGVMMRAVRGAISGSSSPAEARARFSLGAVKQVVIVDDRGAYAGLLPIAALYANAEKSPATILDLAQHAEDILTPDMTIKEVMQAFDRTGADELAVLDPKGFPVGMVSETFATRRYADELEKARRDLIGES